MSNVTETELKFNVLIRVKANLQCYELDECGTLADCASCSRLSVVIHKKKNINYKAIYVKQNLPSEITYFALNISTC